MGPLPEGWGWGMNALESPERQHDPPMGINHRLRTREQGSRAGWVRVVVLYYAQFWKLHMRSTFDHCLKGKDLD